MRSLLKLVIEVLCISLLILSLTACSHDSGNELRIKKAGLWVYNVDFIKKYKSTLDAMFGDDWKVKSSEDKKAVPEEICEHVDSTQYTYTEWIIQYTDGNKEEKEFILNNRDLLSEQIENYVEDYVSLYYEQNFIINT
jgi:hypothetical protein